MMTNKLARRLSLVGVLLVGILLFSPGNSVLAIPQASAGGLRTPTVLAEITTESTPPDVTITANPTDIVKVRKGYMVQISFRGTVYDSGSGLVWPSTIELIDEYGKLNKVINPVFMGNVMGGVWYEGWDIGGTVFTGYVMVEAWAEGWDRDGRTYTVRHTALDLAGNRTVAEANVTILHNR